MQLITTARNRRYGSRTKLSTILHSVCPNGSSRRSAPRNRLDNQHFLARHYLGFQALKPPHLVTADVDVDESAQRPGLVPEPAPQHGIVGGDGIEQVPHRYRPVG